MLFADSDHPGLQFGRKRVDRTFWPPSNPVDRERQFSFPALNGTYTSIQISGDFLPGIETAEFGRVARIRHRRRAAPNDTFSRRTRQPNLDLALRQVPQHLDGR